MNGGDRCRTLQGDASLTATPLPEGFDNIAYYSLIQELPQLRLASLQFAVSAFPSSHVLSRYVCLLAAGDWYVVSI